jgi:hypothetical protein
MQLGSWFFIYIIHSGVESIYVVTCNYVAFLTKHVIHARRYTSCIPSTGRVQVRFALSASEMHLRLRKANSYYSVLFCILVARQDRSVIRIIWWMAVSCATARNVTW